MLLMSGHRIVRQSKADSGCKGTPLFARFQVSNNEERHCERGDAIHRALYWIASTGLLLAGCFVAALVASGDLEQSRPQILFKTRAGIALESGDDRADHSA
jgi:hypothetical protein